MPPAINETGNRYGRLVVRAQGPTSAQGKLRWWCDCDCGEVTLVVGSDLRRGITTSCGCRRREVSTAKATRHGHAARGRVHPLYGVWATMLDRCRRPGSASWPDYGGRGITACDRWLDFSNFLADMGERPFPGATIERIDNDGPYSPENCRWATRTEQTRNRRRKSNARSSFPGVSWHKGTGKWAARDIHRRWLGVFDNELDAARAARPEELP